jgi:hypothetical protein
VPVRQTFNRMNAPMEDSHAKKKTADIADKEK